MSIADQLRSLPTNPDPILDILPSTEVFELMVPVQFTASHDEVISQTARMLERHTRDVLNLHHAICLALIAASGPKDFPVVVRDPARLPDPGLFVTRIHIRLVDSEDIITRYYGDRRPEGFQPGLAALLIGLLNSGAPFRPLGFEVLSLNDAHKTPSAHDLLRLHQRVDDCRFAGTPQHVFIP